MVCFTLYSGSLKIRFILIYNVSQALLRLCHDCLSVIQNAEMSAQHSGGSQSPKDLEP